MFDLRRTGYLIGVIGTVLHDIRITLVIEGVFTMGVILLVLLLALLLGGLGFAVHVLWWIALIVFVAWLVGFAFTGAGASSSRRRWYGRW
jgi:lysylphosphatidylglycerol synthetase-like protein (DUF2156 family)